jgi:hypothetical protein
MQEFATGGKLWRIGEYCAESDERHDYFSQRGLL